MADRHSPDEWAYLVTELEKIVNDSRESRSRREKAQGILDRIGREKIAQVRSTVLRERTERAWTDMDFDGTIL